MLEVNAVELTIILYSMAALPWVIWTVYALVATYIGSKFNGKK
jgi:hypothetical protein